jgi:urease accessory protein
MPSVRSTATPAEGTRTRRLLRAMDSLALLRLQQCFDSQFPVGAFAHSGGIETYANLAGFGPDQLSELLSIQIYLGWGRLDLAAAALAWRSFDDPSVLNKLAAEVEAWKQIPGQRLAGERIGRRTQVLAKRLFPAEMRDLEVRPPQAPVVAGAVAHRVGVAEQSFLLFYAHSNLMAALAAATRSMTLSPERSQEILVSLQPELVAQVEVVLSDPEASLFAATPAQDMRAHQQGFLHTRLFQS